MSPRTRFVVIAGLLLVVLAATAAFLPQTVRTTEDDQADALLAAALPRVQQLASGDGAPSVSLSDIYAAHEQPTGSWTVLARPLTEPASRPDLPEAATRPGQPMRPATVGSAHASGNWRAVLIGTGSERLLIAVPLDDLRPGDWPLGVILITGRLLLLLMVALAGWWLLRLGLRPISEVTKVAEAISSGDRSRRLAVAAPGTAAARLARAFNDMLDQQHASEDQLRRFIADASHELRTPVAAIGGFADLYRHHAIDTTDLDEVMRRIGQESARMQGLVEDMLVLARLDQGRPFTATPVDVVPLAADAVLDASATHPSRTVTVSGPARADVLGDEKQLRQLLANLVTNALNYTSGTVEIGLDARGDSVTIRIRDEGPGLGDDDAQRVFDRFWRGPAARSRAGSGLGLPIARGIARAHNGSLRFASSPSAGTTVTVTLPRGQETSS